MGITDNVKQAQLAVTCLTGAAYMWYVTQQFDPATTTWRTLKAQLLQYFKPPDYTHKTHVDLNKCCQGGKDVTAYVTAF